MTENNGKSWYAMSDTALIEMIGHFIRDCRLQQNKTQLQVAEAAGVSRSTLVLLEKGMGGNLSSLIPVLRVLNQLQVLEVFKTETKLSPIQLAKAELGKRQRARNTQSIKPKGKTKW